MTTIQQPKQLTVKQYEFYKRKGMTDDKVMKQHGMHSAGLNAWKKANNLIGVKFEADVKVTKSNEMGNVQSVDSKPANPTAEQSESAPPIDKSDSQSVRPTLEPADLQILAEQVKSGTEDSTHDSEGADNSINLKDAEIEELKNQLIALEERHVLDGEWIHNLKAEVERWKAERQKEWDCSEMWRNRFLAAEKEIEAKNIDIANLKYERQKQDEALEREYRKDAVTDGIMQMYLDAKSRLNETVEGEVANKWR